MVLCPAATYQLSSPVVFRYHGQKIYTAGQPETLSQKATLLVNGRFATAVYGVGKSFVALTHVRIDGGARAFGNANADRGPLVELGGRDVTGVRVEKVELAYPQGWTCLHLFEGAHDADGNSRCQNAWIVQNYIHDAGLPYSGLWADGISMACSGTVSQNTIRNVTDVGIVLFFNGVTVQNNVIENTSTFGFAAISMGSYKNHRIEGNTIRQGTWYPFAGPSQETEKPNGGEKSSPAPDLPPPCDPDCYPEDGGRFDVAIAVGRPVWSHCNDTYSDAAGTLIRNNFLVQRNAAYRYGGYGIAVARVANIVVTGNTAAYTPSGRGAGCSGRSLPDNASAFQFMECSNCTLQPEFQPAVSLWNLLMRR